MQPTFPETRMRFALSVSIVLTLAACRGETGFTPMTYPELGNDHGQWLSMTTAPDGRIAVSFFDRTMGAVGFALGQPLADGVRWEYEEPDGYPDSTGLNPGTVGTHTSLAFAPDGSAWISYHAVESGALKVAHRVNRVWTAEIVDSGSGLRPKTGLWTSIAIDAQGQPVVAYHDEAAGTLNIARRTEGGWSSAVAFEGEPYSGTDAEGELVERPADVGEYAELKIIGNTEYIALYDKAQGALVLLEGFAGAYNDTIVDTGGVGAWPSMVIHEDTLTLSYHDVRNQNLKLAVREGGGNFSRTTLDDAPYRGADTALFRRADDRWGVLYFDGHNNDARVAVQDSSGEFTHIRLGGETTAVGFHNEVVQDGAGRWWAASYDYTNRNLFITQLDQD